MYTYKAELVRVVDGDTVELKVDTGFKNTYTDKFRLAHIDAPEHNAPATEALRSTLASIGKLTIDTLKPDKYGRWLVVIYFSSGNTVNQWMIDNGFAVPYEGGSK